MDVPSGTRNITAAISVIYAVELPKDCEYSFVNPSNGTNAMAIEENNRASSPYQYLPGDPQWAKFKSTDEMLAATRIDKKN